MSIEDIESESPEVQVMFLEGYIQDNMDELKNYPEYLLELKNLIDIIKNSAIPNNLIPFH